MAGRDISRLEERVLREALSQERGEEDEDLADEGEGGNCLRHGRIVW